MRELSTEIDDSQQLTVEEYRKLIYGQASNCVGKGRARSDFVNNIGKSHSVKLLRNVDDNFSGNKLLRTVNCTSNKELTKNSSFKIFKPVKKTVYG